MPNPKLWAIIRGNLHSTTGLIGQRLRLFDLIQINYESVLYSDIPVGLDKALVAFASQLNFSLLLYH